jgi:hypothetical protein
VGISSLNQKGDVMKNTGLNRRSFVQLLSGAAAGAGLGVLQEAKAAPQARTGSATASPPPANRPETTLKKNVVAIQVKPFCWVDEGIEQVLDNLQQKGNVNTVFTYTYDYDPAQIIKGGTKPLPDHGKYSPRPSWIGGHSMTTI